MEYLIVFLGAGTGGALRQFFNVTVPRLAGTEFPWHTLSINILGSFLMGVLAEYFAFRSSLPQGWRLFFATGVLGGFTTFSAFSLDTVLLIERGQMTAAVAYVGASVAISIGALFLGLLIVRSLT